jgi:hypothetical protein
MLESPEPKTPATELARVRASYSKVRILQALSLHFFEDLCRRSVSHTAPVCTTANSI